MKYYTVKEASEKIGLKLLDMYDIIIKGEIDVVKKGSLLIREDIIINVGKKISWANGGQK